VDPVVVGVRDLAADERAVELRQCSGVGTIQHHCAHLCDRRHGQHRTRRSRGGLPRGRMLGPSGRTRSPWRSSGRPLGVRPHRARWAPKTAPERRHNPVTEACRTGISAIVHIQRRGPMRQRAVETMPSIGRGSAVLRRDPSSPSRARTRQRFSTFSPERCRSRTRGGCQVWPRRTRRYEGLSSCAVRAVSSRPR